MQKKNKKNLMTEFLPHRSTWTEWTHLWSTCLQLLHDCKEKKEQTFHFSQDTFNRSIFYVLLTSSGCECGVPIRGDG